MAGSFVLVWVNFVPGESVKNHSPDCDSNETKYFTMPLTQPLPTDAYALSTPCTCAVTAEIAERCILTYLVWSGPCLANTIDEEICLK